MLVLAVWLAIALRAWPFFTQERVGRNGRVFTFVKLRTLPASFDPYADKYQLPWHEVPWIARKARTLHLDELPQLMLVLLGRMSLVGPGRRCRTSTTVMPDDFASERVRCARAAPASGRSVTAPTVSSASRPSTTVSTCGTATFASMAGSSPGRSPSWSLGWAVVGLDDVPGWALSDVGEHAVGHEDRRSARARARECLT